MKQFTFKVYILLIMMLISSNLKARVDNLDVNITSKAISESANISYAEPSNILEPQNIEPSQSQIAPQENPLDLIKQKVISENRMVSKLDSASFFTLPLGISGGGVLGDDYAIIVDEATIHAEYAEFSAFMVLTNPMDGKKVRFRADNIRFTFKGGLRSSVKLDLIDTLSTALFKDVQINWLPQSFVEWDCNGFKQIGLNGEIELSSKAYVKVNPITFDEIPGKIKQPFYVNIADFNNFILSASLPAVKIKGCNEACFAFEEIALDHSDLSNLPGFSFPDKYPGNYTGEMANLWQGISVKSAKVTLSPKFNKKSGAPTSFYAQNLILDEFGFTGTVGVENLLTIQEGQLGNWPMSISKLGVSFFTGEFKNFTLAGTTMLPSTPNPLIYNAFFDVSGAFSLTVNAVSDLKFNLLAANLTLKNTSSITVAVNENHKFVPTALLDGTISFNCAKDSTATSAAIVSMPQIDFEGLRISAEPPVFDIQYFGFASKSGLSFKAFPITIDSMTFKRRTSDLASIYLRLKLNLTESSGEGIGGELGFSILADTHNWKYKGLEISKISIDVSKPGAYTIKGSIETVDKDPTYGDAFKGKLQAVFGGNFNLEAAALFGNKDGLRYFLVDAFLNMGEPGIVAGPFIMTGFGGGLYYRMRQVLPNENLGSPFGKGLSDIVYIPDATKFIGLKAAIRAGIVRKELVDAQVSFEINFTNDGGIAQMAFLGDAKILSIPKPVSDAELNEMAKKASANVSQTESTGEMLRAKVSIRVDFEKGIYDNTMELYVNVAEVLKGIGENNRAGWSQMYIDRNQKKWFIHMGTPTAPIGLEFVGLMKVGGYFMAGDGIPTAVPLPQTVLSILHMTQDEFNGKRDEDVITAGNGLAFGAFFELSTGEKNFLIFYANLQFGGGYDVLLVDYPDNVYCEGKPGRMGINGWYAKGQAYAYFNGDVGLQVKVFKKRRKFTILNLATAAVIQLEGPNPTFMKGVVGGYYNILGGMVKGDCRFEVTMGSQCNMKTSGDLSDIEVIGDLAPKANAKDVSIFTLPQVVFNLPVGIAAKVSIDANTTQQFKVVLKELAMYDGETIVSGEYAWDADKKTAAFTPTTIFFPNKKYKLKVKIGFQQRTNDSSAWEDYKDDAGAIYEEAKEAEFTTGALPDRIPDDYVTYTYPIHRMSNFYKQESNTAYVTFKSDLLPFFQPQAGWKQQVRWTPVGTGVVVMSNLTYTAGTKSVETTVPTLANSTVYHMDIVNTPLSTDNSVARNVATTDTKALESSSGNTATVSTRSATSVITKSEEKAFYGLSFRTSKYNKLAEKIAFSELAVGWLSYQQPGVDYPMASIYDSEMFDGFELSNTSPLVLFEAELTGATWYQSAIYPLMYFNYPLAPTATVSRDVTLNSVPPTKTVAFCQIHGDYTLSDNDILIGQSTSEAKQGYFAYYLPSVWASDYSEIRNKLSNLVESKAIQANTQISAILNQYPWPQLAAGDYPIRMQYRLPGRNTITSTKVFILKNSFYSQQVNLITNGK